MLGFELERISEIMTPTHPVCATGCDLSKPHHLARNRATDGLQGHALSLPVSCHPARLGHVGRQQTHLGVIGCIRLVIGVRKAHPSWGLEV